MSAGEYTPERTPRPGGPSVERLREPVPGYLRAGRAPAGDGADLKQLLGRLNRDATQLVHDELELAKLELREVAGTFSAELQDAGRTLAKDLTKLGVALSLGLLAGLALTTGAILGIGVLLGGAFWAGGLIVGAALALAAAIFAGSAARDMRDASELRLERARRNLAHDREVLKEEAERNRDFAAQEASAFKREASPPAGPRH